MKPAWVWQSGKPQGTPLYTPISVSASGSNTIVAAVSGKQILVLQYAIVVVSAVTCTWESSGGTLLSGAMPFAANGGIAPPFNPIGQFASLKGEGLLLVLGGAVAVTGHLVYVLI